MSNYVFKENNDDSENLLNWLVLCLEMNDQCLDAFQYAVSLILQASYRQDLGIETRNFCLQLRNHLMFRFSDLRRDKIYAEDGIVNHSIEDLRQKKEKLQETVQKDISGFLEIWQ